MRTLPLLLVLAVTVLVFVQTAGHDFLSWDDDVFLTANPLLQPPTTASLKAIWTAPYAHLYAPVTYSAWWSLARAFGNSAPGGEWLVSPAVYHLASLLVHLLAVTLAYLLLASLVRQPWAAAAGAALFASHPLQVESLAWASELKDLLGGMFGLLAVWLYVRARHRGSRACCVVASAAFLLAILSKPNLVTLPLLALVVDWLLLKTPVKRALVSIVPWLALAVAHAALTRLVQPPAEYLTVPVWQRLFVAGDALAFYLGKLLWPMRLGADYGRMPQVVAANWWGYVTWLAPAALLALAVWMRERSRWALPALLWFMLALLPVLGLLPFDFQQYSTVADHYAYLAMFGPALALAGLALHARGFIGRVPLVLLLVLLAAQSGLQTITWQNNEVFWRHTLEINPRSFLAHNNLGALYMMAGKLPEAAAELEAARQLKPDDADTLVNLGMTRLQMGQVAPAKGLLQAGLRVRPGDPKAHLLLGMIALQGKDFAAALDHLQAVSNAEPQNLLARTNLALALKGLGRTGEARQVLEDVLRQAPGYEPAEKAMGGLRR